MTEFIQRLQDIDQRVTLAVNSVHVPATDQFWQFFSDNIIWIPLYIAVVAFLVYRLGWKTAMLVIVSLALTFALTDFLSDMVKHAVDRIRPAYDTVMIRGGIRVLEKKGGTVGFFSSHAANTFGFAVCSLMGIRIDTTRTYRGYGTLVFIWAALVAASRVFVGKHFVGDVLTGVVFGLVVGYLMGLLARHAVRWLRLPSPS